MKLLKCSLVPLLVIFGTLPAFANENTYQVISEDAPVERRFEGLVESISNSTVAAQAGGRIKAIHVDVDDEVDTGTLLLEIDDTEILALLRRAEASLAIARSDNERAELEYDRYLRLSESSFVSQEQLTRHKNLRDISRATIQAAQARISELEQQLSYTKVVAPYAGVVTKRWVELGETVSPGTPLLTGQSTSVKRVTIAVPSSVADSLSQGASIRLDSGFVAANFTAFPAVDTNTHMVTIRFDLPSEQLVNRPGDYVTVHIRTGTKQSIFVPRAAILSYGDVHSVWVKSANGFDARPVALGERRGNSVEVLSGLSDGNVIAADVASLLSEEAQ